MKKLVFSLLCLLALFAAVSVFAQDVDPKQIISKMLLNYYYSNNDGRAKVYMEIVSGTGQKRTRDFVILRRDKQEGGDQFYYAYFYKPEDVRGVVFMVHKHIDRDDDRWLYLPAIDLVRRISANDKRSSFVGSDFTYEDVSGRHLEDDDYQFLGEEKVSGYDCYVIKAIPKDKGTVEFAYRKIWVDKNLYLPIKVEHYNQRGELYKVYETLKIENIQNTPTITKGKMSDLENNHYTIMEFKKVEYNIGLPEDIFTERFLRRPPREWVR